jgi:hypothetical protein
MFIGQFGGDFKGILPTDGDYTIRVYLMRSAARRNESSIYTLTDQRNRQTVVLAKKWK